MKQKLFYSLLLLAWMNVDLFAQEFVGGEIWAQRTSTYEFDVYVDFYVKADNQISKPYTIVDLGDSTIDTAFLSTVESLEEGIWLYRYELDYMAIFINTSFILRVADSTFSMPDLVNASGSTVDYVYMESEIKAHDFIAIDNSPPIFNENQTEAGFVDGVFYHNAEATDPDNDLLFYYLKNFNKWSNLDYFFPAPYEELHVDLYTGQLIWDKPKEIGKYLIAVEVLEFLPPDYYLGKKERYMIVDVTEDNIVTGIPDHNKSSVRLGVFPNPSTDYLYIQASGLENDPDYQLILSDLQGRVLQEKDGVIFNGRLENQVLDVGDLSSGIYQVLLRFDGYELMKRVVVE